MHACVCVCNCYVRQAFGVLFKKWSGAGAGKGKRESSGSVDLKEFSGMLKSHQLKVIDTCSWVPVIDESCILRRFRARAVRTAT
jgi:hypothetical protein